MQVSTTAATEKVQQNATPVIEAIKENFSPAKHPIKAIFGIVGLILVSGLAMEEVGRHMPNGLVAIIGAVSSAMVVGPVGYGLAKAMDQVAKPRKS